MTALIPDNFRHGRLHPKTVYYIYSAGWGFLFGFIVTITSIYHIRMVMLNPLQLVLVGTVLELSFLLFEIPTGIVADRYSRKLSILIGLIMMGTGFLVEGTFPIFIVVLAAQIIWGSGATFLSGATMAWLTDELGGEGVDRAIIIGSQLEKGFMLAGIFVSIALATIRVNLPFQLSGLFFIVMGLFFVFAMSEQNFHREVSDEVNPFRGMRHTFAKSFRHITGKNSLRFIVVAAFIFGLFSEGFDRLWAFRFLKEIHLPAMDGVSELYWFAMIHSGAILINLAAVEGIKRIRGFGRDLPVLSVLIALQFMMNAGVFVFAMTGRFALALASYWIVFATRHANEPLTQMLFNRRIEDSTVRATVLSMKGQADAVGQVVGGPCIGWLARITTVSTGLFAGGIILLPVMWIYLKLLAGVREKRSRG